MARDKVFISYSHKDRRWLEALQVHLAPLVADEVLNLWTDAQIDAGQRWFDEIRQGLASAKVAVLLISSDFLASKFITEREVSELLKAAEAEGARLLCVYLSSSMAHRCEYRYRDPKTGEERTLRLTDFQGLNSPEEPLLKLQGHARQSALKGIAEAILDAAQPDSSPPKPAPSAEPPDLRAYLEWLEEENRFLEIRGMGARITERVELERVYTRLRVVAPREEPAARREAEPGNRLKAGEALACDRELHELLAEYPRLLLVGDPGSGKTTFLRFVAQSLARARLGNEADAAMLRIGLGGPPPLPVLVRLEAFASFLATNPAPGLPDDAPKHLFRYLDQSISGFHLGLPDGYLERQVLEGDCFLLLDGLDEVAGTDVRVRVGRIVDQAVRVRTRVPNRYLVTARTRAYQAMGEPLARDLDRADLVDFGAAQVEEFVRLWAGALYRLGRAEQGAPADAAEAYANELLGVIRAHPSLGPLTANPLLLTVLGVVHWTVKRLPEQRAELYEAAVDCLVASRVRQSDFPAPIRKEALQAIAARMFEDPAGVRRRLDRAEAAELVRPLLQVDAMRARAFLQQEEMKSGILASRIEGELEFWHLTFQEYLAGLALSLRPDGWEVVEPHLYDDRWSEVVLLLAGCTRRLGLRRTGDLIQKILDRDRTLAGRARAVGLIGRILRDVLPYGGDPSQGTGYADALRDTLAVLQPGAKPIAEDVRVELGEALGQAGDPRLHEDDQANRVLIRGGRFWMGAQKDDPEKPGYDTDSCEHEAAVHRVTLSDFWIDRYPVTVQQYKRFVGAGAGGYLNKSFWTAEGWTWRENKKRSQPGAWEEQLRHLNRPVVRVSWYEADAYCRWLSVKASTPKAPLRVSLPTEAQWEFAARGEKGRKYPWGDARPTDERANFALRLRHATPVGIYPLGATPDGLQDLAGNVLEWCQDWFSTYPSEEQRDPVGPPAGESRLLRGGGFAANPQDLRAASRNNLVPANELNLIGFRCVVAGGGGQSE